MVAYVDCDYRMKCPGCETDLLFDDNDIVTKDIPEKQSIYTNEGSRLFHRKKVKTEGEITKKYDTIVCPICKKEIKLRKYLQPGYNEEYINGSLIIRYSEIERPGNWLLPVKSLGSKPVYFKKEADEWKQVKEEE